MRILHCVEFYHPSVGGAQEVVRQLSEHLVQRGHGVTVATTKLQTRTEPRCNGVYIEEFAVTGNQVVGMKGEIEHYQTFVRNGNFDVIMVYAAQQWTLDALIPILAQLKAPLVFVPCGFSGLFQPKYQEYFRTMPSWLKYFQQLVFLSNTYQDINFVRQHGFTNMVLIPNGADEREFDNPPQDFRKKYGLENKFIILTVGGHTGVKGHTFAMRTFLQASISNATLVIIGNTPVDSGCKRQCAVLANILNCLPGSLIRHKRIILMDPPRADVVSAFSMSDLFILPSNIEASPLVLFESMAAGLPYITFDVGNAKEITEWSRGGLIAETHKHTDEYSFGYTRSFARQIEKLYHDPNQRHELGHAGRAAWKKSFTFDSIAGQYERLYRQVVTNNAP